MTDKQPHTLADMTPEQRQQCVGMWCDCLASDVSTTLCIYVGEDGGLACVVETDVTLDNKVWTSFRSLTPRFDLPRAWNPDGTPLNMNREKGWTNDAGIAVFDPWVETSCPPNTKVRRWVSEPEEIE